MAGPLSMVVRASAGDAPAARQGAAGGARFLRSVAMVTHCVEELDLAERHWTGLLGYTTVARGELGRESCAAWNTPAACDLRFVLMLPQSGDPVYLRFIETGEHVPVVPATQGWSATELLVQDVDALARRLEGTGFRRLGGPADLYARPNAPRAMQVIGPSGELIYFTRLLPGGSRYGLRQARSPVDRPFIVTVGGPASAALPAFYGTVLGHRITDTTPFVNTILATLCQVSPDTIFPTTIAPIPGRRFLLEMDEYPPGVAPRARRPGHLPGGMAMVSFGVRDLGVLEQLGAAGVPTRAAVQPLPGLAYGGRRVAVIEGPAGEWLELIEEMP